MNPLYSGSGWNIFWFIYIKGFSVHFSLSSLSKLLINTERCFFLFNFVAYSVKVYKVVNKILKLNT